MSAADLMTDLARLGIRIEAHGDRLRYSPQSAVMPDLVDRMKAHKGELLAILRDDSDAPVINLANAMLDEAVRSNPWDTAIDFPEPCRQCGGVEFWQTIVGDLTGVSPGKWQCLKCEPPTTSRRLRERVAKLKFRRTDSPESTQRARGGTETCKDIDALE